MVVGKHEVKHPNFMAFVVQVPGDVGKANRHRLGIQPALEPVVAVGGDE